MPLTPSHAAVAPLLHRATRRLGVSVPISASSVIGLVVVALILWRWVAAFPKPARRVPVGERGWRARELGLILLLAVLGAVLNERPPHPPGLSWRLGLAAVGGMSALAVALLAYGILDLVRHRSVPGRLEPGAND